MSCPGGAESRRPRSERRGISPRRATGWPPSSPFARRSLIHLVRCSPVMAAGAVGTPRSRRKAQRRSTAAPYGLDRTGALVRGGKRAQEGRAVYFEQVGRCARRLTRCLGRPKLPRYNRVSDRWVLGGSPGSDGESGFENLRRSALVAQRIEHLTSDQKVGSSSLSEGTSISSLQARLSL